MRDLHSLCETCHRVERFHPMEEQDAMWPVFVYGTLKRGFPLHPALKGCPFVGHYRTVARYPMFIAGPRHAPMMLDQPGCGHRIVGELYTVDANALFRIDQLESVGAPGNVRIRVKIEGIVGGRVREAWVYVKGPELAVPAHSGYLDSYQHDPRFVPPARAARPKDSNG